MATFISQGKNGKPACSIVYCPKSKAMVRFKDSPLYRGKVAEIDDAAVIAELKSAGYKTVQELNGGSPTLGVARTPNGSSQQNTKSPKL